MTAKTIDSAHSLREFGLSTALTLRAAVNDAEPYEQDEVSALAARLFYCNQKQNTWTAEDLHSDDTGDLFDGFGRYWHCYSKLCPYCLRLTAKRNRKKLREAISRQRLLVGQHYRFITLTIPNLGLDLAQSRSLVNRAWSLFRKRESVFGCVVGGAKAEEFTVTATGFHYHLHLLVVSRFIHKDKLRQTWTDCVRSAFHEANLKLIVNTVDGLLFTNIKIVHDLQQVVNEVCKYITKSSSWHSLPPAILCKIAMMPRWTRMFEMFGSFRSPADKDTENSDNDLFDGTIIDRRFEPANTEPPTRKHWRLTLAKMTLPMYLKQLRTEVLDTQARRHSILQLKFPFATIKPLDDG